MNAIFYPSVHLFDTTYIPEILHEIYMKGVYVQVLKGYKDLTILDFGANCGLATQYFRDVGKVYAVEPCPDQFEALKLNKEYNGWDNVEIFNLALADHNGQAVFHTNRTNMTAGSLDNDFYNILRIAHKYEDITVKTVTIDTFVHDNKIDKIDFMKMDIEGQENSIMQTEGFKTVLPKIQACTIEFHSGGWEPLVQMMKDAGFGAEREPVETNSYLFTRLPAYVA
jgi:FkbM family methyltransferase